MGTSSATTEVAGPVDLDGPGEADQFIEIGAVGWDGYLRYLRARGERSRPKMIYLDGSLTLVSPGQPHERLNVRVSRFFYEVFTTLDIPTFSLAQTTWRRRKKDTGVEGDQTYYLANEPLVRDKPKIDLSVDPPPDLAIEVVDTHKADKALEVYARLGVPEVWVCDSDRVRILVLGADGVYNEATRSTSLPFLTAAEIFEQTRQPLGMTELEWVRAMREWVRDVLLPRHRPA